MDEEVSQKANHSCWTDATHQLILLTVVMLGGVLLAHEGRPSGGGAQGGLSSRQLTSNHLLVLHTLQCKPDWLTPCTTCTLQLLSIAGT